MALKKLKITQGVTHSMDKLGMRDLLEILQYNLQKRNEIERDLTQYLNYNKTVILLELSNIYLEGELRLDETINIINNKYEIHIMPDKLGEWLKTIKVLHEQAVESYINITNIVHKNIQRGKIHKVMSNIKSIWVDLEGKDKALYSYYKNLKCNLH